MHLSKTKTNKLNNFIESVDTHKKFVNLNIGDSKVLYEIDLYDDYFKENDYEKNILIKIDEDNLFYSIENPVKSSI